MAKYLVVKVEQKGDECQTDYGPLKFIMSETIDLAETVELTRAEAEELEGNRWSDSPHLRCLEVIGPAQVRAVIRERAEQAKKKVAALAVTAKRRAEANKKREATKKQRALEKARALLEAEGK